MKNIPLIFISVLLGAVGQLLIKKGMMVYGKVGVAQIWSELIRVFLVPYVFIGFICFVTSAILWLSVISKNEISFAYPMVSLGYILILIVSIFWFNEAVTWVRFLGVVLICLGVIAITRT